MTTDSASPTEPAPGARPIALVTGATRGIGRAIADDLARDHHVLVGGRDPGACAKVAAAYPDARPWPVDVTDPAAVVAACAGIERLDVLVHSAGVASTGRLEDVTRAAWTAILDINVVAVAELTRLLLPALRASTRAAGGQVALINSAAVFVARPEWGAYAASKAALSAYAGALREEERGAIRVTSIHPGRVDTDMQVEIQSAAGRAYNPGAHLRPESVAAAVRLAVDASPEAMVESLTIRPVRLSPA